MSVLSSEAVDEGRDHTPRRILIVSAKMGEGHNAAARAVEQAARRLWPVCETEWVDVLERMGPGVGPVFRRIYVTNVQVTPWLYDFFYRSLWRYRWFATASKRFVGVWSGTRLGPVIEAYRPDLIISTYPLGSAGLEWLRKRRGLRAPIAAWINDFCPHPFWVYRDLDIHYVMHEVSAAAAEAAEPGAPIAVSALPVVDDFRAADKIDARRRLGIRTDAFVALLTCGYYGFGTVENAVDGLLQADPGVQVVAVTGRNEPLRRRLLARREPTERLLVQGWTDDMPAYMAAGDIVVTNAGGATSLEAVSCGRPVVMFQPIAAHGRANAELMHEAGLALISWTTEELARTVGELCRDHERRSLLEEASLARARKGSREADLTGFARSDRVSTATPTRPHRGERRRVRPHDAFFLYTETPTVAQVIGGFAVLDGKPDFDRVTRDIVRAQARLPMLRTHLARRRSRWARPVWIIEEAFDPAAHLEERILGAPGQPSTLQGLVEEFYSTPVDPYHAPWAVHIAHGLPDGRSVLLVKFHHALGDGFAVVNTIAGFFTTTPDAVATGEQDEATDTRFANGPPAGFGVRSGDKAPAQPAAGSTMRSRLRLARAVCTGVWHLARSGPAPASGLNGPMKDRERRFAWLSFPMVDVTAAGRGIGASTSSLLIAVVADAVHHLLAERGEPTSSLRAMVPRTVRGPAHLTEPGNFTAAVSLDIPLGEMSPADRAATIRDRMHRYLRGGEPEASRFFLRLMGLFPAPVHARLARAAYNGRWFNLIMSVIPGPRRDQYISGVRLGEVYPVLPVADEVGLSIGLIRWGDEMCIGVTADATLVPDVDRLAQKLQESFSAFRCASRG